MFILSVIIGLASIILFFVKSKDKNDDLDIPGALAPALFGIGFILFLWSMVTIIPAGQVGVRTLFGDVDNTALESGFHLVNPLAGITKMNIQTEAYTMSATENEGKVKGDDGIEVLTSDGLTLKFEITAQYRLLAAMAPQVYRTIGEGYEDKIIRPEIRSALRDKAVNYVSTDIYSTHRDAFVTSVKVQLDSVFKQRGIVLEAMLLRDVKLPASVQTSINEKISAQQDAQKMEFVLQKEKQEADRKRIEAQGIQDFQKIVSQGISDQLLQWKGIEATEKLAQSDNAKVVVIGNSKGLPLILGN